MASYHHRPFATFALTGKGATHGALNMRRDRVTSYNMEIATLDRETRTVTLDASKVSRTTSMHQGAITLAFALNELPGWTLVTK